MEDVTSNKRKMKELEDNLLYRLTSTKVSFDFILRWLNQEMYLSCIGH